MPAFREKDSRMSILNRLSRAGVRSGCFESRNGWISTGERVWSVLSERLNDQKDRGGVYSGLENSNAGYMQLTQDVTANFGRRHLGGNSVSELLCSHNVEHCLQNGAGSGVPQHDILQNTKNYDVLPQLRNGNTSSNSWRQTAPLAIDIPNDAYVTNYVDIHSIIPLKLFQRTDRTVATILSNTFSYSKNSSATRTSFRTI